MTVVERILQDLNYPPATWHQRCILATFGFPGAGKSTVATGLSQDYPLLLLSTDLIRLKYGFTSGPETLKALYQVGAKCLSANHSLIFDGIHMLRSNRDELRAYAQANQAQLRFIHVFAAENVIAQRLQRRRANPEATEHSGKFVITEEHFQRIIQYYEPPVGEADVIAVDTSPLAAPVSGQLQALYTEMDGWRGQRA